MNKTTVQNQNSQNIFTEFTVYFNFRATASSLTGGGRIFIYSSYARLISFDSDHFSAHLNVNM